MIVTMDFFFDGNIDEKTVFTTLIGTVKIVENSTNNTCVFHNAVLFKTDRSFYVRFTTTDDDSELVTIQLGLDLKMTGDPEHIGSNVHVWATVNLLRSKDNQKYAPFKGKSNLYTSNNSRFGPSSFEIRPFSFC